MFWIGFDTPSIKDLKKYKLQLEKENMYIFNRVFSEKNNQDYIKIIVNMNGEIIWLLNKISKQYYLFNDFYSNELDLKLRKNLKFLK